MIPLLTKSCSPLVIYDRYWFDKLYLMPIPQSETDMNPKLLPNNPGY
ncbi:RagB/SusD family nutrient uptake outer membrane protein [Chitinophaga vietnamensis]